MKRQDPALLDCRGRRVTKAVLLAAGAGRRLLPATRLTPKPLLQVSGRHVIDFALKSCLEAGVTQVFLVVGAFGDAVAAHVRDRVRDVVQLSVCWQQRLDGTASALLAAKSSPDFDPSTPAIVMATDYVISSDYVSSLASFHCAGIQDASIGLYWNAPDKVVESSLVTVDSQGRLINLVEKPSVLPSVASLSAALVYIIQPRLLDKLCSVQPSPRGERELPVALQSIIADGFEVRGLIQRNPTIWESELRQLLRRDA